MLLNKQQFDEIIDELLVGYQGLYEAFEVLGSEDDDYEEDDDEKPLDTEFQQH